MVLSVSSSFSIWHSALLNPINLLYSLISNMILLFVILIALLFDGDLIIDF